MSESQPAYAEFKSPAEPAPSVAESNPVTPVVEAVGAVEAGPTPEQLETQQKNMIEGATTLKQMFFDKLNEKFISKKYIELVSIPQEQVQPTEDGKGIMKIERDIGVNSKILTWNKKHKSCNVRFGSDIESVKNFKFLKVHFIDSMWEGMRAASEGKTKEDIVTLLGETMGSQLNDLVCDALDLWLDRPEGEPEVKAYGKLYSVAHNYFGDMWNYAFFEDVKGEWTIRVGASIGFFFIEDRKIII